jgi:transcriptional regulator with XRE-family HTH domain
MPPIRELFLGSKPLEVEPPLVTTAPLSSDKRRSHFAERLRDYIDRSGLTQEQFAESLSATLSAPISRSRLTSWLNSNASPRLEEISIFEACDAIVAQADGTPQSIPGAQAAAAIKKYLKRGLTRKALTVAGQVPQSTLSQWEAGQGTVKARPWLRFVALVDSYIEALKKTGTLK